MNQLIGITGLAQSGKSTVAKYLKDTHLFTEDSFAAPIRSMVAEILGIGLDELEHVKESYTVGFDKTPREMMQTLGTEWGRFTVQDNLWVIAFQRRLNPATRVVVSDIRFENEATAIRELGGTIWHVKRADQLITSSHSHLSEQGIAVQACDEILLNINSLDFLHGEIESLLRGWS